MNRRSETLVVFALAFLGAVWAKEMTSCTTGNACFPYEPMPVDVTSRSLSFYCCPQVNMTRNTTQLPDKTFNCSCVEDLTLESKIRASAWMEAGTVRMCSREKDCEGLSSSSNINDRFKFCCYSTDHVGKASNNSITIFDGDKEQFIMCRCLHLPLPTPDPKAYVIPPVLSYNSTGEACSYDEGCQDRPYAKCQSTGRPNVTFCCYGSRGVVTQNDGNLTRCTCTQDVFRGQCEARPITIADSTASCLTECSNRSEEDTCTDSKQAVRCCPHNMAVEALQSDGSFSSCTCKANVKKACRLEDISRDCLTECSSRPEEDTCTDSYKAVRCCPHNMAIVALQSNGSFSSCTCKHMVKKSCGKEASHAMRFSGRFIDVLSLMFAAFVLGQMRH